MKLALVGDIFPANLPITIGYGIASNFHEHKGEAWREELQNFFVDTDVVLGNLESPLVSDRNYHRQSFKGPEEFAGFLEKVGVNVVSIANNHILEQGKEGYTNTRRTLKSSNIKYIGDCLEKTSNIQVFNRGKIKVGFCAFNNISYDNNHNSYAKLNKRNVEVAWKKLERKDVDWKIISLHWGEEYIHYPSPKQVNFAHQLIDMGFDVLMGHHPHVIQPIEQYKHGIIFYSLGNFLFDMLWSNKVRIGLIINLCLEKNSITFNITSVKLSRSYCHDRIDNQLIRDINRKFNDSNLMEKIYDKYEKYSYLNSFKERVLMKIQLLRNWNNLDEKGKKEFFSRIKGRLS